MTTPRTERHDIEAIYTDSMIIELAEDQFFCTTDKSVEIWQRNPLWMIKRISKKKVMWIILKDSFFPSKR